VEELVADKGYHSGEVLKKLHVGGVRSYLPEPSRGKRNWEGKALEQKRTYQNRRRVQGDRGKRLQKIRSELTERTFAHMYETGAMRRVHLRGSQNILKRLLIHGAAFNLSLILRKQIGAGKPKQLHSLWNLILRLLSAVWTVLSDQNAAFPNNQINFATQSDLA
jgi:transposase